MMKRFFSIFVAALLLIAMSVVTFADEEFIPSVGPGVDDDGDGIIITHIDNIDEAHPEVDTDEFKEAFDELKNADPITDLNKDIKNNAVVRDFYDITFIDEALEELEKNGEIKVTVDAGLTDDNFQVIFRGDDGWDVLEDAKRNIDGSVTVTLKEAGQLAILTYVPQGGGAQTSDPITFILAGLVGATAVGCAVIYTRKKFAK